MARVGDRRRFSPGLLLAALARLLCQPMSDLPREPCANAADFDEMVAAIGEAMIGPMLERRIGRRRRARTAANAYMLELSDDKLCKPLEMFQERERIAANGPGRCDTSDLDPRTTAGMTLHMARAERSADDEPSFGEANPTLDDDCAFPGEDGPTTTGPSFH